MELPPAEFQVHPKLPKLRIAYAGLLNCEQDPAILARAIQRFEKLYPAFKGSVSVDFYGPKNYYTELFLQRNLNRNIRFHGYLPFQQVLEKIRQADLAYSSLAVNSKIYCIPSKIFQYIAMETPILATGPAGSLQNFINEQQIGRFSLHTNLDAQANDLYDLITQPTTLEAMRTRLREVKTQFSMQTQVEKLSEILHSLG